MRLFGANIIVGRRRAVSVQFGCLRTIMRVARGRHGRKIDTKLCSDRPVFSDWGLPRIAFLARYRLPWRGKTTDYRVVVAEKVNLQANYRA